MLLIRKLEKRAILSGILVNRVQNSVIHGQKRKPKHGVAQDISKQLRTTYSSAQEKTDELLWVKKRVGQIR